MGSKMQTGLLLILGTVVSLVGWMAIYPGDDSATAESAAALMADPTLAKLGMLMGFGGMGALFIGFLNISRKMAAGDGAGSTSLLWFRRQLFAIAAQHRGSVVEKQTGGTAGG